MPYLCIAMLLLGSGAAVAHAPELVTRIFDEELKRILSELPADAPPEAVHRLPRREF